MAGVHVHPPAGHDAQEVGRKTEIPFGGTCDTRRYFRGSDIPTCVQHGADAVSAGRCASAEGMFVCVFFREVA